MAFKIKFLVIFIVGAVCLILGGVIYAIFPNLIEDQVKEQVVLKKGTTIFDNWKKIQVPMYMNFYFFNTTNADDVIKYGAKPSLKEVGPYAYEEYREKLDIKFIEKDDTITYRQNKKYIFQKGKSCDGCDVTDRITLPNIPAISIVSIAEWRPKAQQTQLPFAINTHKVTLYRAQTVRELIFDGYRDPFVALVQSQTKEEILPNATFAILYAQNDTDDGEYEVHSGVDDPTKFADVIRWQNMTGVLPYWPEGSPCAMINGTDGFQYAPFVTKDTILRMLIPEIYRSVFTVYDKETEVQGISCYRFITNFNMFGDPSLSPDNSCFWPYDYLPSGVHNISTGRDGAPIFFSNPHFYLGDPMYLRAVDGLKPRKDKHQTIVDVEPTTGTVVRAARRIQVNVYMKPAAYLKPDKLATDFTYMPELVHPIVWIDEGAEIDEPNADKFINMLYKPKMIGTGLMYGLMALGSLLIVVSIGLIVYRKKEIETSMSQQELTRTAL